MYEQSLLMQWSHTMHSHETWFQDHAPYGANRFSGEDHGVWAKQDQLRLGSQESQLYKANTPYLNKQLQYQLRLPQPPSLPKAQANPMVGKSSPNKLSLWGWLQQGQRKLRHCWSQRKQEQVLLVYLGRMLQDKVWGQDIELEAFAQLMQRTIVIYGSRSSKKALKQGKHHLQHLRSFGSQFLTADQPVIGLLWHCDHYSYLDHSWHHIPNLWTLPASHCVEVPADGNCLFHAMALSFPEPQRPSTCDLRLRVCRWLYAHAADHVPEGETCTLFEKMRADTCALEHRGRDQDEDEFGLLWA